jgi:hypothetical protein
MIKLNDKMKYTGKTVTRKILTLYLTVWGPIVAQSVEALRYKPEGRGFNSQWGHWDFSLT